ncbi:hypothetical protein DFS34DRAFT_597691 [Phlyctochytrium arcticum]|nr:hypothetical protein DFS34DRAFT_597691 [Phlyctochytrium arcticum]
MPLALKSPRFSFTFFRSANSTPTSTTTTTADTSRMHSPSSTAPALSVRTAKPVSDEKLSCRSSWYSHTDADSFAESLDPSSFLDQIEQPNQKRRSRHRQRQRRARGRKQLQLEDETSDNDWFEDSDADSGVEMRDMSNYRPKSASLSDSLAAEDETLVEFAMSDEPSSPTPIPSALPLTNPLPAPRSLPRPPHQQPCQQPLPVLTLTSLDDAVTDSPTTPPLSVTNTPISAAQEIFGSNSDSEDDYLPTIIRETYLPNHSRSPSPLPHPLAVSDSIHSPTNWYSDIKQNLSVIMSKRRRNPSSATSVNSLASTLQDISL